jgi:hypothetical protein
VFGDLSRVSQEDRLRVLDALYIPNHHPDSPPEGAPTNHFGRLQSEDALNHARSVDANASGTQGQRLLIWPLAELPLGCDALVLTPAEHARLLACGLRMAAELQRDTRWLWERPQPSCTCIASP